MKLRLRSMATTETFKIDLPNAATIANLRARVSSLSSIPSSHLHFSLNRSDEIWAPSSSTTLSSLGLASGDLLFFSPSSFSPNPFGDLPTLGSLDHDAKSVASAVEPTSMDVDSQGIAAIPEIEQNNSRYRSPMLPWRFLGQLIEEEGVAHEGLLARLVVMMHAVFLDCGFVVSNGGIGDANSCGMRLPQDWVHRAGSALCLKYTLPKIASQSEGTVTVNLSVMGDCVVIYGCCSAGNGGSDIRRVCVNSSRLVALLSLDKELAPEAEMQTYELWKELKDGICFPLLIAFCRTNGLQLPACFSSITADVKARILELMAGVDVARVGSTCIEMRDLASDEILWKQKYEEEFNGVSDAGKEEHITWKQKFVKAWRRRSWVRHLEAEGRARTRESVLRNRRFGSFAPRYNPNHYRFFGDLSFPGLHDPESGSDLDVSLPRLPGLGSQMGRERRVAIPRCDLLGTFR